MITRYLQISYYTLTGIRKLIDLGDLSYCEWIVYSGRIPAYHINLQKLNESDKIVKSLIDKKQETIESIIDKINKNQNTNLSLGRRPFIEIVKKEELIDFNLDQLPERWLKAIY